ncbi:Type II secretion system protein G precursor [Planctomycetes bacterium Poly30]|uniref:Type II secretion system protein G n=1 Tax=Saltatorellus ferox TaxID=2528018 RepID=A0A518ERZ6_9BACT|nr:Type II secretion system protein G precursor [Planctomycetes bacterium Poly30]
MTLPIQPRAGARAAFTLIELVVVLTILITLAGIVVPRVSTWTEKAKFARAVSDMKAIKRSVEYMYQDMGYFPGDQSRGIDPGIAVPDRVPSARRGDWKGPYLEMWPQQNPWGGTYDYEYWNYAPFNFDGVAGNEVLVTIRDGYDASMAQRMDEMIDDGNVATGMARYSSGAFSLFIGEGRRW